jgi:hypothetical protein
MSAHMMSGSGLVPCATAADILGNGTPPVWKRRGTDRRWYRIDNPDESRMEHARRMVRETSVGARGSTDNEGIRGR